MMENIVEIEKLYELPIYKKRGIVLKRGKGAKVYDILGKEYIDCVAGHGVGIIGHSHPDFLKRVTEQLKELVICAETFSTEIRALYLKKLVTKLPQGLNQVFFSNSGAEAIEAALKFARLITGRHEIIAFYRAFHGRTFGALSATFKKGYKEPYEPLVPGFKHLPFNNIEALEAEVNENTAAVLIEPIQGEAGVYPAEKDFLLAARELTNKYGALIIFDEVQTGFGRTGKLFAFEHFNVAPDILVIAKGMAGGIPAGAAVVHEKFRHKFKPGLHGSTFGGNPIAMAGALATLEIIEVENLISRADTLGKMLLGKITGIHSPLIREVRGLGLMIGIEIKTKVSKILQRLASDFGILALPAGLNVIRLLPPLVISEDEINQIIFALQKVLSD